MDAPGWLLVARFREATGDLDGAIEAANAASGRLAPGRENDRAALMAYAGHLQTLAGKLANAEVLLSRAVALASDVRLSDGGR